MSETITRDELLRRVHQSRAAWERALTALVEQAVKPADKEHPADRNHALVDGPSGSWSLKELLGHILWYEREMIQMLRSHVFSGSSLWDLPLHQRNAEIYDQVKGLTLPEALAQSASAYAELDSLLESLTDEDLNQPERYPGMPSDWLPWHVIASNTYEHYDEHIGDLTPRLRDQGPG
jgi:uncharacterized damage-inducible protein DinB